ncbi:MAG: glycosyltransferase family 2 protein [Clostridia bacterium]|nr:glycosyltransferase family 2 protein [Clostridia bacterium]
MPKLSIIIPVYNAEDFLYKSVDAVINQTFQDWELILVNDGSRDESLKKCQEYAEKESRIKIIDKQNEGAGPARNAGISVAQGEYVTFIDADDWMEVDAYKTLVDEMEKTDADLLLFGMKTHVVDKNDSIVEMKEDDVPIIQIVEQKEFRNKWTSFYEKVNMDSVCNKIFKSSIIKSNGLNFPPLRRMQDGVFNMYYAEHVHHFITLNKNFYNRKWNCIDTQRKKIPPHVLDCALAYYKTAQSLLEKWGLETAQNKRVFLEKIVELLHVFEFVFIPKEGLSFSSVYNHLKSINSNAEVHQILKEYKKAKGKIRLKEKAMLNNWNLLLAFITYRQIKKG